MPTRMTASSTFSDPLRLLNWRFLTGPKPAAPFAAWASIRPGTSSIAWSTRPATPECHPAPALYAARHSFRRDGNPAFHRRIRRPAEPARKSRPGRMVRTGPPSGNPVCSCIRGVGPAASAPPGRRDTRMLRLRAGALRPSTERNHGNQECARCRPGNGRTHGRGPASSLRHCHHGHGVRPRRPRGDASPGIGRDQWPPLRSPERRRPPRVELRLLRAHRSLCPLP